MEQPTVDAERVADETARRLLERATALESDGPTLAQLREAATEAGISHVAFDAAVAEWRADSRIRKARPTTRTWTERGVRNVAALAVGWLAVAVLAVAQQMVGAPWLVHKFTDSAGMAIGAFVASRLRARTATVVMGGLAVSQGAEFLMDLASGKPAIHGLGAHWALMIAGVAGVAVGRAVWERRGGPGIGGFPSDETTQHAPPRDSSASRSVGPTNAEADKRFMELLRLRRSFYLSRLQLS